MTNTSPNRPHHGRKLTSGRGTVILSIASIILLVFAIERSYNYARENGLIESFESNGDGGRVLRMTGVRSTTESSLFGSSTSQQSRTAATSSSNNQNFPSLEIIPGNDLLQNQDQMVESAIRHVEEAAEHDPVLQWNPDPELEAIRFQALAEMMGLNEERAVSLSGPTRDYSVSRARRSRDLIEAVRGCTSLECLRIAHTRPPGMATFNFPHFMFLGWQKTATSALHIHLNKHPQIIKPWDKEPEFFSSQCNFKIPDGCSQESTLDYIRRVLRVHRYSSQDGQLAAYDASTHYSRNGNLLAQDLSLMMPWLKLVATLREPISRAASMLIHIQEKNINEGGCLASKNNDIALCLKSSSQISGEYRGGPTNYSLPLHAWLESFPSNQVHLIQYENLMDMSMQRKELRKLKRFLGVQVDVPTDSTGQGDLGLEATPEYRSFSIKRARYQELIDLVRPDCEAVVGLIDQVYKKVDSKAWFSNWEKVWNDTLKTCDSDGNCTLKIRIDD